MKRFNDRESGTGNVRPFSMHLDRIGGESRLFLDPGAEGGGSAAGGEGGGEGGDGGGQQQQQAAKTYTKEEVEAVVKQRLERDRKGRPDEASLRQKILAEEFGLTSDEDLKRAKEYIENQADIERKQLEAKGQYEKALSDIEKKHRGDIEKRDAETTKWRTKHESQTKRIALTDAALKAGAVKENIDLIVLGTESAIKVLEDDTVQVVGKDGLPMLDTDTGQDMTVEKYMKNFLAQRPSLVEAAGGAGAGTGSQQARGKAKYTPQQLLEIQRTDPNEYARLRKEGVVQQVNDEYTNKT